MPQKFENRTIEIQGEYVSCTTCAVNYNKTMDPLYCQEFHEVVKPRDVLENHAKALGCKHYCPTGLPRWARVKPHKSTWEKD